MKRNENLYPSQRGDKKEVQGPQYAQEASFGLFLVLFYFPQIKGEHPVLAGMAWWIECWPAKGKVAGSIPSQDTCLGCGPGPQLGHVRGS